MDWTVKVIDLDPLNTKPLEPDIALQFEDGLGAVHVIRISGDVTNQEWLDDQIVALAARLGAVATLKATAAVAEQIPVADVVARVTVRANSKVDTPVVVVEPVTPVAPVERDEH